MGRRLHFRKIHDFHYKHGVLNLSFNMLVYGNHNVITTFITVIIANVYLQYSLRTEQKAHMHGHSRPSMTT